MMEFIWFVIGLNFIIGISTNMFLYLQGFTSVIFEINKKIGFLFVCWFLFIGIFGISKANKLDKKYTEIKRGEYKKIWG